jgi:sialidase-1
MHNHVVCPRPGRLLKTGALSAALIVALICCHARADQPRPQRIADIFTSEDAGGGENIHLPSLLVTKRGVLLAVCQLRKKSPWDFGHDTDILLRRSVDGGLTWEPIQVVYRKAGINAVNGPIVQDRDSGSIILPITEVSSKQTTQAQWVENLVRGGGSMNYIRSDDDGKTWSPVKDCKPAGSTGTIAWPSNSSHGIQLARGRLVLGAFIATVKPPQESYQECEYSAGLVFSDDHGATWRIGAHTPYNGTDEIVATETTTGEIYVNFRHNNRNPYDLVRGFARSRDHGESFYELGLQENLSRTDCHVGLIRNTAAAETHGQPILIYSGPTGLEQGTAMGRHHLAVRISYDDGRTWPVSQMVNDGSAAYSDLAIAPDGTILCLYGISTFDKKAKMDLLRMSLKDLENQYQYRVK